MPKRISPTNKVLQIFNALAEDSTEALSTILTYSELRKYVWGNKKGGQSISRVINSIKRSGYLEIVEKDNQKAVKLTKKGWFKSWNPHINKEWDGRWRLVAFDIPESRKKKRDSFRHALKMMGFIQMQKSLWICPYDVSEEIEEIIDMLDIEENVDYFIADAITNKQKYIDLFDLNQ